MRLVSCHIQNFGVISDLTYTFSEGLNTICEENGWGKSTFAAFIRAMFYGLEGERKKSLQENERLRYRPWNGGVFGGSLTFEIQGRSYEITRIFHEKSSVDEWELRDAVTNVLSTDYSERIGEEIFGVDRESFLRSLFIGQDDCRTHTTDEINARIGQICENTNDLNSYEAAMSRLEARMNALTPKRATGSIAKRQKQIAQLEREITEGEKNLYSGIETIKKLAAQEAEKENAAKKQSRQLQQELNQQIRLMQHEWKQQSERIRMRERRRAYARSIMIPGGLAVVLGILLVVLRIRVIGIILLTAGVAALAAGLWISLSDKKHSETDSHAGHHENPQEVILESQQSGKEMDDRIAKLNRKMEEAVSNRLRYLTRLEEMKTQKEDIEDRKIELQKLKDLQKEEQEIYDVILQAGRSLKQAKENMVSQYARPISEHFAEYYEMITGETARDYRMDGNADVTVMAEGRQRETAALSAGMQDLIGFALRIAYVDAMYPDEKPMLILDDPFVSLDDQKLSRGKALLRELSDIYQIIYLTCSINRK